MCKIRKFAGKVYLINPAVINISGTGIPGNIGSSTHGATTSANDIIYILKKDTAALNEEYNNQEPDVMKISELSRRIEGSLMTLEALSVINHSLTVELIEELHDL